MKIYLDVCCLNRPFDDLSIDRNRLEAEAILTILAHCQKVKWILVNSSAVTLEVSNGTDKDRKQKVTDFLEVAKEYIQVDDSIYERSIQLEGAGFGVLDSIHIACAEKGQVDVLLSTDDGMIKRASKGDLQIGIPIKNPLTWLMERGET